MGRVPARHPACPAAGPPALAAPALAAPAGAAVGIPGGLPAVAGTWAGIWAGIWPGLVAPGAALAGRAGAALDRHHGCGPRLRDRGPDTPVHPAESVHG